MGKSGGALIQQILIFGVGSLSAATPYLGVILSGLVFLWIQAANDLAGQFNKAMEADDSNEDADETQSKDETPVEEKASE